MNYIRQKLHQKFAFLSELSIRAKIQLLVISSILVLSIISLGGTQMIIRKYNETLYQSVETSLSYSTKEISSYLDTIDNMADQILANKTLQESLASWSDASASLNSSTCNGVQREHNKKLNNGLPILHKVPPKRDYGRYFCIMAEKGGTSHGGLTEKLSLFFHAKKQEVNAYGR